MAPNCTDNGHLFSHRGEVLSRGVNACIIANSRFQHSEVWKRGLPCWRQSSDRGFPADPNELIRRFRCRLGVGFDFNFYPEAIS
jgi:hypothetical protein